MSERLLNQDWKALQRGVRQTSRASRPVLELYDIATAVHVLKSETPVYLIVASEDYVKLARVTAKRLQIVEIRSNLLLRARRLLQAFRGRRIGNLPQA